MRFDARFCAHTAHAVSGRECFAPRFADLASDFQRRDVARLCLLSRFFQIRVNHCESVVSCSDDPIFPITRSRAITRSSWVLISGKFSFLRRFSLKHFPLLNHSIYSRRKCRLPGRRALKFNNSLIFVHAGFTAASSTFQGSRRLTISKQERSRNVSNTTE